MAEATLGIAFKPVEQPMRTLLVDEYRFAEERRVVVVDDTSDRAVLEHVSCGHTFPGHEVAVLDEAHNRLPEGTEGELCFRGPSVTAGYFGNPEATAQTFVNGWLRTGDLGYLHQGEVYVTGRIKDLIILRGRNVHPQAVEWAVADLEGVRQGNVIAFSVPGEAGEDLVVVLETRLREVEGLVSQVATKLQRELSLVAADIRCVKAGALPKTSSGKLQRRKAREFYLAGGLRQRQEA